MPTTNALAKFIHVLCGTSTMGLSIAQYYYLQRALTTQQSTLIRFSQKFSRIIIYISLLLACIPPLSGWFLVGHVPDLGWSVAWVQVAMLLGISILIILLGQLWLLKNLHCKTPTGKNQNTWRYLRIWNISHYLLWLAIILIIRDAVTRSTWL